MITDEIDGPGPAKGKPISRKAYDRLQAGLTGLILAVMFLAYLKVKIVFASHLFTVVPLLIGNAATALTRFALDSYLRRRGMLPHAVKTVEIKAATWTQDWAHVVGVEPTAEGVVEVRRPRSVALSIATIAFILCFPLLVLTGGLITLLIVPRPPGEGGPGLVFLATGLALATVGVGLVGVWYRREGMADAPWYRLDAAGIAGPRGKPFIPWAAVASYRVMTSRNPVGDLTVRSRTFTARDGKPLLHLRLAELAPGDADRLLAFIAARFPKPAKDDRGLDE